MSTQRTDIAAEDGSELARQSSGHLQERRSRAQPLHRGDAAIGDAAGHDHLPRCGQHSLRSGIDMRIQPSLSRSSEQGNNESVQRHWFDHLLSVHGVSPRAVHVSAGAAAAANRSWNIR